jgi:hypothetical protein
MYIFDQVSLPEVLNRFFLGFWCGKIARIAQSLWTWLDGWGSIPCSGKRIFSSPQHSDWLWGPPSLLSNTTYQWLSPGVRLLRWEADNSRKDILWDSRTTDNRKETKIDTTESTFVFILLLVVTKMSKNKCWHSSVYFVSFLVICFATVTNYIFS